MTETERMIEIYNRPEPNRSIGESFDFWTTRASVCTILILILLSIIDLLFG
jgi:hypothetical protein